MADDLNYSESLARHSFYYLLDNAEESTRTGLVKENVPRQVKIDGLASYRDAVPRAFPTPSGETRRQSRHPGGNQQKP